MLDFEKQARTVDVEVDLVHAEDAKTLLVGYSADVEIILEARDAALRIPTPAGLEGARVLLWDVKTRTLVERKIEAGISNWSFTEVRAGLAAGEKVVLSVERAGVKAGVVAEPERAQAK